MMYKAATLATVAAILCSSTNAFTFAPTTIIQKISSCGSHQLVTKRGSTSQQQQYSCMSSTAAAQLSTRMMMSPLPLMTQQLGRKHTTRLFDSAAADGDVAKSEEAAPATTAVSSPAPAPVATTKAPVSNLKDTLLIGSYFGLWYLFNIGYNIYNKRVLNVLPLPWLMASLQLGTGILWVVPQWITGLRKAPKLAEGATKNLSVLAAFHTISHICAVLSLGAGAVSFTHIVKAAEPVFTAAFGAIFLGTVLAWPVYVSLLPVIFGVALASLKELSFSWIAFGNAMGSNTGSALRGIYGKKMMGQPVGENMDSANLYAVLTIIAFCMLTPMALLVEGPRFSATWAAAIAGGTTKKTLIASAFLSGFFYYLYNEVAFLCLGKVDPVTHAVGNTIKRVVIIVSAVIAFRTPMTPLSIAGSSIAIIGTLIYSLVKQHFDKLKKTKKA